MRVSRETIFAYAKKILREPLFYLLPLCVLAYLVAIPAKTEILDVKVTKNNKTENIKLPYSAAMPNEAFLISFNLNLENTKSVKFKIIPDDCIEKISINGNNFPLDGFKGLCDYGNGVSFDFSNFYIHEGLNSFEFRIRNHSGPGGLRIETPCDGFRSLSLMCYVFALLLLLSAALILRKLKFKFIAIFIILLGITVRLIAYTYTSPMQKSYDVNGHLEYIQIIAEEKRMPKNEECWSCYHPPLYYATSAVIKNIADLYDSSFTNRVLQQFSLLLSFASIVFGVAFILNLFGNSRFAYLASLVLVLWPGFAMAAPRIGNDSLFYLGALLCIFSTQRYFYFHKNADILYASLGASIAFAAKSTGLVILGVWVIIFLLNAIRSLKIGSLRMLLASMFIVALFIGFSNYRTIIEVYEKQKLELVGNINSLNVGMKVQNTAGNYLYFDLQDYLLEPYASTWDDKGGRQYFWNFALKSSLFGEFRAWNAPIGYIIATLLNILVLLIFVLALWGIIHVKFKEIPSLLFIIFLFAALIYLRARYPYSCSNDFRYIFPALFPLAYFAVRGAQILQNMRFRMLSYIAMLVFSGLSFIFIVGQAV